MPSYTYKNIQDRIADELNRGDLTAQIKLAIISAIEHYERERWWFEESISTAVSTTAAQNYVTDATISSLAIIDKVQITVGSAKYTLTPITYDEWAIQAMSTTSGQPTEYAYYQNRLYLYPTPGDTYVLTISGVQRLTTLSADLSNNGFTNYCEEVIRQRAKADVRANVILDEKAVEEAKQIGAAGQTFLSG
ncbi:MAG: hypothetical protein V1685_00445, partial [Parcubacteria group bacterium]